MSDPSPRKVARLKRKIRRLRWPVMPFYRWYDLWIGAYYDTQKGHLYLCCLGFGVRIKCGKAGEGWKAERVGGDRKINR